MIRLTERVVCPVALIYYVDNALLAAWCELRGDYRHFRVDRILRCVVQDASFIGKGMSLREGWQAAHQPFGQKPDSGDVEQEL